MYTFANMKNILRSLSKLNTFGTIIIFFYLIVIFSTSCLNSKNDKQSLQSKTSLNQVDTLFKKANAFIEADPKLVLKYLDTVNSINKNNYLIETEIQALYLKGKCYRMLAKNKEAYANVMSSLQKAEEVNNKYYKVLNLNEISQIKFNENKYNEADSLLDISEEIAQKNDFKTCLSAISNSKAIIAGNNGQKTKAIQLFFKTLDFYKKDKNEKSQAIIYNNIGLLYRSMTNYTES